MRALQMMFAVLPLAAIACHQAPAGTAQHQQWTCAMHPQIVRDQPGPCPICGMQLVPRLTGAVEGSAIDAAPPASVGGSSAILIDPERRRLIGLKTVAVRKGPIARTIRTSGRVAFDETRVVQVQPRFEGYIDRLYASFTGQFVKKGEPLAAIYSPDLLATEEEYLLARRSRSSLARAGLPDAASGAAARLRNWGIGDAQIAALARRGKATRTLDLTAPISGFVTKKDVVQGAKVGAEQPLFEIVDLSRVWVLADVYEYELPRLALGQRATLTLSYWPGRSWIGKVSYVFPTVDEKTRTVRVRIEIANPKTALKPEMFGEVVIEAAPRSALLVPEDAVIDTGTRQVVFVSLGDRLEPREVRVGDRAAGVVEIKSGLSEGESVASGASFLLDSESRLRSAISEMRPAGAVPAPKPDGGRP